MSDQATRIDDLEQMVHELAQMLDCILDYAGEGNCGRLVGYRQSYREARELLNKAYEMLPNEEAEHLAELNRGYAQDRI